MRADVIEYTKWAEWEYYDKNKYQNIGIYKYGAIDKNRLGYWQLIIDQLKLLSLLT